jgi:hypothetical protein
MLRTSFLASPFAAREGFVEDEQFEALKDAADELWCGLS